MKTRNLVYLDDEELHRMIEWSKLTWFNRLTRRSRMYWKEERDKKIRKKLQSFFYKNSESTSEPV